MQAQGAASGTADLYLRVHGRVQGVGFREGMIRAAAGLRLDGWVRNRADGTVEAVARGAPADCDALLLWAQRGPPGARVERVEVRPAQAAESALVGAAFRRLESR
jgi:acylphosphatase